MTSQERKGVFFLRRREKHNPAQQRPTDILSFLLFLHLISKSRLVIITGFLCSFVTCDLHCLVGTVSCVVLSFSDANASRHICSLDMCDEVHGRC